MMAQRGVRAGALRALAGALSETGVALDAKCYAAHYRDTLVPGVRDQDFTNDLQAGDGKELARKFRAAHSSSALSVNAFAPFRRHIGDLRIGDTSGFDRLQFERKCPTGIRGGRAPNLDVVVEGANGVIAIESKLTEMMSTKRANFAESYAVQITDERRDQGYYREMMRLRDHPAAYATLDAAQLIKHAFGLHHTFRDQPVTLLYLYWEPRDAERYGIFRTHRLEVASFARKVAGAGTRFDAMSYAQLFAGWQDGPDWLRAHVAALRARYDIDLDLPN